MIGYSNPHTFTEKKQAGDYSGYPFWTKNLFAVKNRLGGTPRVEPEFGSSEIGMGMGMYDSKAQDWEGDEINPFPQLGNEKGMNRMILAQFLTIFQFLCDARS